MTLVCLFFVRKKAIIPLIIYAFLFLALAVVYFIEWFGVENLTLAQSVMTISVLTALFIASIVYASDIRTTFFKLSGKHRKQEAVTLSDEEIRSGIGAIVTACQALAKSRTGALIVLVHDNVDRYIVESGVSLDANISAPLLESIFNTKCPMHDGAVIIKNNRIVTAGSFLPLTQSTAIDKNLGTRHRAALGVTESSPDIISIVISEESGIISTAQSGTLRRYLTPERLFDTLYAPYSALPYQKKTSKKRHF